MVAVVVARAATSHTMVVVSPNGSRVSMYSTPPQFKFNENHRFGSIDREGYKPITRAIGEGLATLSFTSTVYSLDHTKSIEHIAAQLVRLSKRGERVRFNSGSVEFQQAVWWNIKSLDVNVTQLSSNNQASRIELEWSLEEAVDVAVNIARVVPPPPPPPPAARPIGRPLRTHRVVSGDTLWGIARRYLGNGGRWPEIFNMNRGVIRNPNLIFPGQIFKVPA